MLQDYTMEQLKEEIERRETLPKKPEIVGAPNFATLQSAVEDYIDFVWSKDYNEDGEGDYIHYIFEDTMKAFYGEDVFDKINKIS